MAVLASIQDLKNLINDTIYANDAGLVDAETLQERLHDIIDTLGGGIEAVGGDINAFLENDNNLAGIKIGTDTAATQEWVNSEYGGSKISSSEKGTPNGVATLDSGGKIPAGQMPASIDEIIDSYHLGAGFGSNWLSLTAAGAPLVPATGKIYIVISAGPYLNKVYRWSGSVYVEISQSTASADALSTAHYWFGEEDGRLVWKKNGTIIASMDENSFKVINEWEGGVAAP